MAFEKVVRPKQSLRYGRPSNELDMRGVPLFGKDLVEVIIESVAHTQRFVIQELPNWLIASHKQFVSLLDYTEEMEATKDRMFITPLNVMEVDVDEDLDHVDMIGDPDEEGFNHGWDEGEEVPDRG